MLGTSVSKLHEFVPVVENKDPHWLHARLEQTPSETPSIFHQTHNSTLRPNSFFNDDFGRLTGTEPLFWGVSVAVIDPFCITCDYSPDKSLIHGITDNLSTDIHSMFNLLMCQFMRYRSTASVWFSKCLNLSVCGIFWCRKSCDEAPILKVS